MAGEDGDSEMLVGTTSYEAERRSAGPKAIPVTTFMVLRLAIAFFAELGTHTHPARPPSSMRRTGEDLGALVCRRERLVAATIGEVLQD